MRLAEVAKSMAAMSALVVATWSPVAALAEEVSLRELAIPDRSGTVMTVTGPIQPEDLGPTVTHEHVFIDLTLPLSEPEKWAPARMSYPATEEALRTWQEPLNIENRSRLLPHIFSHKDSSILQDFDTAVSELRSFHASGGRTIVDVTSIGVGRDPVRVRSVSRETSVRIVMGTGFYRKSWHPSYVSSATLDDLTEVLVRDLVTGMDGSDVRAGIIGEISAEDLRFGSEESDEVRALRAAARASRLTGAAISVHNYIGKYHIWHRALDVLEEEGADLGRVIVGHVDAEAAADEAFLHSLLQRGVYLQFDILGAPWVMRIPAIDNRPMIEAILRLVAQGYSDRLLLSQDVCTKFQLKKFGGNGYDYVLTTVVPYLLSRGVTSADIRRMLEENPARVLTFVEPKAI